MSATLRELEITYNGFAVGRGTTRPILDYHRIHRDRDRAAVTFDFLVYASSESNFASACQAAETAFAAPYKDFSVKLNSTSVLAVTQSGNTGLDAMPRLEKPGGRGDSARSRIYRATVEFGLPASWATVPGLRDATIDVAYTPARRRRVIISGTFTALTGNGARAQYAAQIDAYAASIKTALGVTEWDLDEEPRTEASVNDKTLAFTRVYLEVGYEQGGASNDAGITRQVLVVTKRLLGPERGAFGGQNRDPGETFDTPAGGNDVTPLIEVEARWDVWIDRTVSTDLEGKYSAIRDWLVGKVRDVGGGSQFALVSETPSYERDDNRIVVAIQGLEVDPQGGGVLSYREETRYDTQSAYRFIPAWVDDPDGHFIYSTKRVRTRTTSTTKRTVTGSSGGATSTGGGSAAPGVVGSPVGGGSSAHGLGGGVGGFSFSPGYEQGAGYTYGGIPTGPTHQASDPSQGAAFGSNGSVTDAGSGGVTPDHAAGGLAAAIGGGAGRSGWFPVSNSQATVPLQVGRRPFVLSMLEETTVRVDRYAVAIAGSVAGY